MWSGQQRKPITNGLIGKEYNIVFKEEEESNLISKQKRKRRILCVHVYHLQVYVCMLYPLSSSSLSHAQEIKMEQGRFEHWTLQLQFTAGERTDNWYTNNKQQLHLSAFQLLSN